MRLSHFLGSLAAFACLASLSIFADEVKDGSKGDVKVKPAGPGAAPQAGAKLPVYKLRDIVGMHVRDTASKDIGKIEDLVVEMHSGDVRRSTASTEKPVK